MRLVLASLFLITLIGFAAYGQDKAKADRIKIVSVSAENPVRDAVANDFTVQVDVTLDSVDEGILSIGFNVDKEILAVIGWSR